MSSDFQHTPEVQFDFRDAIFLAQISKAAYEEPVRQQAQLEGIGATESCFFDTKNIQGSIVHFDSTITLVFRGTNNLGQWVRDARIAPAAHPWGFAHSGFVSGVEVVAPIIEDLADSLDAQNVFVTGHSLGGGNRFACRG